MHGAGLDREPYARRPPPRSAFGRVGPPPQGGRGIARRLCENPIAPRGAGELHLEISDSIVASTGPSGFGTCARSARDSKIPFLPARSRQMRLPCRKGGGV